MFKRPGYAARADRELRRRSALAIATKVAPGLATLAINVLIGRVGGVALLGLTQTAMSTATLLSLLYPAPAAAAASRFVSAAVAVGEKSRATRIASYLARRVLIATACFVLAILVVAALFQILSASLLIVTCIITLGISFRVFIEGLHFGGGEGRRLAKWSVAIALFGVTGTLAMLGVGVRDAWVIAPMAAANLLFVALSWPARSPYHLSSAERRDMREFIWLGTVGTLASAGFVQATTLVAVATAGITFAGEYAAALTLSAPLAIFSVAISATLFPALSALTAGKDLRAVRSHITQATSLIVTIMGLAVGAIFILADPVVALIWGPDFSRTSWIVLFLLTSTLGTAVAVPAVTSLTSSSNRGMRISALSSLTGSAAGAVVWVITIPWSAEVGVMSGYMVAALLSASIPYFVAWRKYRLPWFGQTLQLFLLVLGSWTFAVLFEMAVLPVGLIPVVACGVLSGWMFIRRVDIRRTWEIVFSGRRLRR